MAIDADTQKRTWLSGVPHELSTHTNFGDALEYAALRSRTGLESPNFGYSLRMMITGLAPTHCWEDSRMSMTRSAATCSGHHARAANAQ
jgi:hypothetical protein